MPLNLPEPLALYHSWPMTESGVRLNAHHQAADSMPSGRVIGTWSCDLRDNRLVWSDAVYDLFGLERGSPIDRRDIVGLYRSGDRDIMEQLRAHAIRHRRGFTMDAEIETVRGQFRWMRLAAVAVCKAGKVVALQGLKQDVSVQHR
ncbi:hypothetical protein [Stakelama sediminis]